MVLFYKFFLYLLLIHIVFFFFNSKILYFILYTYLLCRNSTKSFLNLCSPSGYVNIGVFVFSLVLFCFVLFEWPLHQCAS